MSDAPSNTPPAPRAPSPSPEDLARLHLDGQRRVVTMVRWLLYLVFLVIGYVVLRRLAPIFTPILAAAGIAYLLDPLVDRLEARGIPRSLAVGFLLVAFLGTVTSALVIIIPLARDSVTDFINNLPGMVDRATEWLQANLDYELPAKWQQLLQGKEAQAALEEIAGPTPELVGAALGGFFSLLGFLAELLLIPVFAFYFMVDWDHIVSRVRAMIPPRLRGDVVQIIIEIDSVVSNWIRGQLTVTSILAVLYAVWFYIAGVPLAIPVGVLVGLFTIIPFLGTFVGAGITGVLILLDWQGPGQLATVAAAFVVLHLVEAAVLTPKLVGKRVGLGESGALFAVLAGGQLLGLAGVLLAVPLAASIAVLIRRLVRYYAASEFFGADDEDGSIEATALASSQAVQAVTLAGSPQASGAARHDAAGSKADKDRDDSADSNRDSDSDEEKA